MKAKRCEFGVGEKGGGKMRGHSSEQLYTRLTELAVETLQFARVPYPAILEIGTAEGGSAEALLRGLKLSGVPAHLVTVDPYGHRPYPASGSLYGGAQERDAIAGLGAMAREHELLWHHERYTSLHFLDCIAPLGFWQDGRHEEYEWALAFLDGEHVWQTVKMELNKVKAHLLPHGVIVVDNVNHSQEDGTLFKTHLDVWCTLYGFGATYWMPPDGSEVSELRMRR